MRVVVLAGLITVATVPFAAASESEIECQFDESRRASAEQRLDVPPTAPAATPPNTARPLAAPAQPVEAPRQTAERRRNGKRVPDATLMSPRGVL